MTPLARWLKLRPRIPSRRTGLSLVTAGVYGLGVSIALAAILDDFGPPPDGDPSAFTGPSIGLDAAVDGLAGKRPANEGAFEGGPTGTEDDAGINVAIREDQLNSGGKFDIPTGGKPSPLFGAGEYEQQLLLFESFGATPLGATSGTPLAFPLPTTGPAPEQDPNDVAGSVPEPAALAAFLSQPGLFPFPSEYANDRDANPWSVEIERFLGRALDTPPAEGRPPGKGWAHQRWNEFFPRAYFKTAQTGVRTNRGLRDSYQGHGYLKGEFGPGGLYYTTFESSVPGTPKLTGTTRGIAPRFHPRMPIQDMHSMWTFDGTFPPKLAVARYGQPILLRHYNALPIDPSANRGFGLHTISTHEHNGHNPAESDGYTNAFFFPGQYYDYRWPMQLAGHDTVNTTADDPRAAFPCTPGEQIYVNDEAAGLRTCDASGRIQIRGDWRETMSTHWFHDHMLDFTAQNVYKGNAVMFNYYSALDRGNEAIDDGVNLRLPSGSAQSWGNRDYDVNLVIADKAWDAQGQLWFNIFNQDGFLGDQILINFQYKPYLNVRARRYRLRILNGSVSRYYVLALVKKVQGNGAELKGPAGSNVSYQRVPFHMVANDGNVMEHAVPFDGSRDLDRDGNAAEHKGMLPEQGIAERYDIVVDFAANGIKPGDRLYLVNVLEHVNGRGPKDRIPLADVLSEKYKARRTADRWEDGDPGVGRFLELRVVAYSGQDRSMNPVDYEPGKKKMIPLPIDRTDPRLASAVRHEYKFSRSSGTDSAPWTITSDGSRGLGMDPRRVSTAVPLATAPTQGGYDGRDAAGNDGKGTLQVWTIRNDSGGWAHPVHIHFEEGVILKRGGKEPPEWEKWARKDVYRIGPDEDSTDSVEVALRFREFAGTYMEHCHNTQHEDHSMLLRWDLEHPGQVKLMPAPLPTWDGVEYVESVALPTFRTGLGGAGSGTSGGGTSGGSGSGSGSGSGGGTSGGGSAPAPAPTGTVSIKKAELVVKDRALRVEGSATQATSVSIFSGAISGTICSGAPLGSAAVSSGSFSYRATVAAPLPDRVCVLSSSGAAASLAVERK